MLTSVLHKVSYFKCTFQQGKPPLRPSMTNTWIPYFSTHFNRGNPPPSLSIEREDRVHHRGQGPINERFSRTVISKEWNKLPTRRFVPVNFKETLCSKVTIFQSESRGKEMPNQKGLWRTPSSCEHWCSQEILCQKKGLDKSQTWKGGLGKNERLGGLKTRKGSPGKS